jgi:hypothetical protein
MPEVMEAEEQDSQMNAITKAEKQTLIVHDESNFSVLFDTARFEQMQRIAKMFASSELVPAIYQNKPSNVMVTLQMALRMNIDPMMMMQNTYIVQGKPGIEAKLAIALVNTRGPFDGPIQWRLEGEGKTRKAIAYAKHKQTHEVCEAECSMTIAEAEGWLAKSGSKWKTMPDMMLRYRSAMFLARLYAPECLMGMQTVDELIDITRERDVTPRDEPAQVASITRTEAVKAAIKATKVDPQTGEVTTSFAVAAEAINKAQDGAQLTAAVEFIEGVADAQHQQELRELAEQRAQQLAAKPAA